MTTNQWVRNLPADKVAKWVEYKGEAAMARHHTSNPHFALWLHYLDRRVGAITGMTYRDLEDYDYWSMYEGDYTPAEAAEQMLEDYGYSGWEGWK